MQVNITDGGPRVGPRPGWDDDELPNFKEDLGLDEDITDLDEETIEEHLVPAARNDLAKQRQSLLATMLLMGINRIIVTDGKINAKLKFNFRAKDSLTSYAVVPEPVLQHRRRVAHQIVANRQQIPEQVSDKTSRRAASATDVGRSSRAAHGRRSRLRLGATTGQGSTVLRRRYTQERVSRRERC